MEKVRYMISDAANLVHVEAHVLRYWEEELELTVPRNEMGHRYYTRENIQEFQRIKDLKEKGYQLKAIRMILHNGEDGLEHLPDQASAFMVSPDTWRTPKNDGQASQVPGKNRTEQMQLQTAGNNTAGNNTAGNNTSEMNAIDRTQLTAAGATPAQRMGSSAAENISADERMAQFRELMSDIVGHAISLNNEELSQIIGQEVGERVLKEMNYLAREQDEAQEERYRQLDAAIRGNLRRKKITLSKDPEEKLSRKAKKELQKQERLQKKQNKKQDKRAKSAAS